MDSYVRKTLEITFSPKEERKGGPQNERSRIKSNLDWHFVLDYLNFNYTSSRKNQININDYLNRGGRSGRGEYINNIYNLTGAQIKVQID